MPEVSIERNPINRNNKQIKSLSVRRLPTINREEIIKPDEFEELEHHRPCASDRDATRGMSRLEAREFRQEAGIAVRNAAHVKDDGASSVDTGERLLQLAGAREVVLAAKFNVFDRRLIRIFQRGATILRGAV